MFSLQFSCSVSTFRANSSHSRSPPKESEGFYAGLKVNTLVFELYTNIRSIWGQCCNVTQYFVVYISGNFDFYSDTLPLSVFVTRYLQEMFLYVGVKDSSSQKNLNSVFLFVDVRLWVWCLRKCGNPEYYASL